MESPDVIFDNIPRFVEIIIDESIGLMPNLPKGRKCQDMHPELQEEKYEYFNTL